VGDYVPEHRSLAGRRTKLFDPVVEYTCICAKTTEVGRQSESSRPRFRLSPGRPMGQDLTCERQWSRRIPTRLLQRKAVRLYGIGQHRS